ncbi:hypothetical protein ACROYT_G032293 [Oculina patagonica]
MHSNPSAHTACSWSGYGDKHYKRDDFDANFDYPYAPRSSQYEIIMLRIKPQENDMCLFPLKFSNWNYGRDLCKTVQIPDDYKLVSFDVKSLFTSIPLQLALQCTETAIQQSTVTLPLPTEDIMDLLNLCLTSTYFQYNGKHYKQLHGTAMGSPVSVVVAEIVMQNIEERALATCRQTIPLWLRYVDDTFTAVHKDEIDDFHKHLNEQNADIQFTREIEENGKLPFLDCLVSRDNNKIRTTVYRKPTHTDRLLDETSYNPTSHKATTIKTLTRRAQLVCDTPDSLSDENKYLDRVFHKNNYNTDFIRRNTHRTTETDRNLTSVTTATLPYIKGTSETIARILQPYNIRVAHKPITTLRHLLTNVKHLLKTGTNLTTDRERFIRSNAPTARPPTSERPVET